MTGGARVGQRWVTGLAVGILLGLVTVVLMPVVGVVLVIGMLIATGASMVRRTRGEVSAAYPSGALGGAGVVFLLGVVNTTVACLDTADFCGQTNVVPLLVLALAALVVGAVATVRWRGLTARERR